MYILAVTVIDDFRVDIEADRHLHTFAGCQHLFGKAETLDLVEKRARRVRGHIIAGLPGNRAVGRVIGLVKGQPGLADAQFHLALDRFEFPGHAAFSDASKRTLMVLSRISSRR